MKARLVLGGMVLSLAAFLAGWSASSHNAAVPAEASAPDPNLERVLQRLEDLEARLEQRNKAESGEPKKPTADDLQDIEERIYFPDQPSHMTPERVHGGIQ
jgi:hypothetical protein